MTHTKQAVSTTLYNRTQSFGTQAFNTTKHSTSLARSVGSYQAPDVHNAVT